MDTAKHLKLYFQSCLAVGCAVIVVGFILPSMFSANNDFWPIMGIFILLTVPAAGWLFYRHIRNELFGVKK